MIPACYQINKKNLTSTGHRGSGHNDKVFIHELRNKLEEGDIPRGGRTTWRCKWRLNLEHQIKHLFQVTDWRGIIRTCVQADSLGWYRLESSEEGTGMALVFTQEARPCLFPKAAIRKYHKLWLTAMGIRSLTDRDKPEPYFLWTLMESPFFLFQLLAAPWLTALPPQPLSLSAHFFPFCISRFSNKTSSPLRLEPA